MVDVPDRAEFNALAVRAAEVDADLTVLAEDVDDDRVATAERLAALEARVAVLEGGTDPGPTPNVTPTHSDRIADVFGGNARFNYSTGPYSYRDEIVALCKEVGFRSVRDLVTARMPAEKWAAFRSLVADGILIHGTAVRVGDTRTTVEATAATVRANADLFCSVGGANEPHASQSTTWPAATVDQQRWLYAAIGGAVPVVGPALKDNVPDVSGDFDKLGAAGVAPYADYGDFHRYPRGVEPTNGLDERAASASAAFGGKPLYCTEGGYNTSASSIPENVAATYAPRQVLEMVLRGYPRFHVFELVDTSNDPAEWSGHYGLVECPTADPASWRRKESFHELVKLSRFLADPGPTYVPPPVHVTVDGPADLRNLVVGKRDGSTHVVLWRDIPHGAAATNVTVTSGSKVTAVRVGDRWTTVQL